MVLFLWSLSLNLHCFHVESTNEILLDPLICKCNFSYFVILMQESLSTLEAEYKSGSAILLEKIKVVLFFVFVAWIYLLLIILPLLQLIGEQYAAMRRTRGDGNCFFRSFMFAYLVCHNISQLIFFFFSMYFEFLSLSLFFFLLHFLSLDT